MLSQKECVYKAISKVLNGQITPNKLVILTDDQKKQVIKILVKMFNDKVFQFANKTSSKKYSSPEAFKAYAKSLLTNSLLRDTRLNGGKAVVKSKKITVIQTQYLPESVKAMLETIE